LFFAKPNNFFWRDFFVIVAVIVTIGIIIVCLVVPLLAYLPVLAELAKEIAAIGCDAKSPAARKKMIKRLFFNGINVDCARPGIHCRIKLSFNVLPSTAQAKAARLYNASPGAKLAPY
jgi:hypothetical protein